MVICRECVCHIIDPLQYNMTHEQVGGHIQWNWIEERKHDMVILESMFVTHYWPTMYMVLSHTVENCVVKYGRIIMGYGHSQRVCLSHYSLDTITYNPTVLCIFLKSSTWPTSPNTFIAPYQCLAASRCDHSIALDSAGCFYLCNCDSNTGSSTENALNHQLHCFYICDRWQRNMLGVAPQHGNQPTLSQIVIFIIIIGILIVHWSSSRLLVWW